MVNSMIKTVALTLAVTVLTTSTAHAYTDPGSGMLIWQLLVSALVGGLFYFRKAIARIRDLFKTGNDGK